MSDNCQSRSLIQSIFVNPILQSDTTATACESFDWYEHTNLTQSGDYTHTLPSANAEGCDSVITLHLTILRSTYLDLTVTACEEYRWEVTNITYEESGDYVYVTGNAAGCDSIVTLHLTINQPSIVNVEATVDSAYTWEVTGETYTSSGVYSHTIYGGAENGCDSTIILTLTIKYPDGI